MILLRHGQSEFNLHFTHTRRDPGIRDPKLTALGWAQAREAGRALAGQGLQRILVSPYTRALETAHGVNEALRLPIHVNTVVRERYAFVCDIGTRRSALCAAAQLAETPGMARTAHAPSGPPAGTDPASTAHRALVEDPVVWLSSVQRDGRPHVVPVWFHWNGEAWEPESTPTITHPRFTGTGTRFLRESGRKAVEDLFARSFQ